MCQVLPDEDDESAAKEKPKEVHLDMVRWMMAYDAYAMAAEATGVW